MLKWYQKNSPLQTVQDLDEAVAAGESTENIYIPGNTTPPDVVLREGYSSSNTTYPRTYATYDAQMKLNDDIDNNKSGYLGVETMSIKDFYNAGGNFFVEDYNQAMQDLDSAYDRALPGYGTRGEQMAQGGLTGSGYGDYLSGQAYAVRAQGQAAARQQYEQSRRTFLATYNQYRENMAEQRRQNLLQTVQSAYAAGQSEEMYAHYAKAVGIPQEDIERGMMALRALYNGYTPGQGLTAEEEQQIADSPYGVTDEQMTTVDGLYQQIIGGIDGMTDEDGMTVVAQYPTLDAALAALKGSYKDPDGKILEAAKQKVLDTVTTNITSTLSQPNGYVSKATLDRYADYGIFGEEGRNSEQYKTLLDQAQEKTYTSVMDAYYSNNFQTFGDMLASFGIDASDLNEDNAGEYKEMLIEQLYANEDISKEQYQESLQLDQKQGISEAMSSKDLEAQITKAFLDKDKLGDLDNVYADLTLSLTKKKKGIIISNGTTEYVINPYPGGKNGTARKLDRTNLSNKTWMVYTDGNLYMYSEENGWEVKYVHFRTDHAARLESKGQKNIRDAMENLLAEKISLLDFGVAFLPNVK